MAISLDLQIEPGTDGVPHESEFVIWIKASLQREFERLEQTIRIVQEAESLALNSKFRGIDRPTNVLAFPGDNDHLDYDFLGDLVICAPVVLSEARQQQKSWSAHWAHMVVHGMLHLQGYDHDKESAALQMEALEIRILNTLGYTNPYNEMPN